MASPQDGSNSQQQATVGVLHQTILQTLASAVISIRPNGEISTFNAAASEITGLNANDVIGRTFAEVFFGLDDTEDFTQAVLDSVYEGPLITQRVVEVVFQGRHCSLSVSVSRIAGDHDEDSGVAVVFEDISELRELRSKELALAHEIETQHQELREAYLQLEEQNNTLAQASRQTRMARLGSIGAVVVLLTVVGLYVLDLQAGGEHGGGEEAAPYVEKESAVVTVESRQLNTTVTVPSRLSPLREVDVTSPISGKVSAVRVAYGARVEEGDILVELDDTEVRIDHRAAQASHIKAQERLSEVENWSESVEVSRARRSLAKTKLDLEDSRSRVEETAFLLERGVIPSSEHIAAQRAYSNRQLDLEAAEQDHDSIVRKGVAELRLAKLEATNAKARLDELEETLRLTKLRAPVAGVVLRPPKESSESGNGRSQRLAGGESVNKGDRLLIVGDLNGLSIIGRVDEVDVLSIRPGNEISVRGDAFPNTLLEGSVHQVSSEALVDSGSLPYFEVTAIVPSIAPEQREELRIGMSAELEIITRSAENVVLVPIEAITLLDGSPTVRYVEDGEPQVVSVQLGVTTVNAVEIVDGLVPGDQILVTQR